MKVVPTERQGYAPSTDQLAAMARRTCYVHLGLRREHLDSFLESVAPRRKLGADVRVDGDGWEVWGEPEGTGGNRPGVLHVVVRIVGQQDAGWFASSLLDSPRAVLQPMRAAGEAAGPMERTVVVVTGDVWSDVVRVFDSAV